MAHPAAQAATFIVDFAKKKIAEKLSSWLKGDPEVQTLQSILFKAIDETAKEVEPNDDLQGVPAFVLAELVRNNEIGPALLKAGIQNSPPRLDRLIAAADDFGSEFTVHKLRAMLDLLFKNFRRALEETPYSDREKIKSFADSAILRSLSRRLAWAPDYAPIIERFREEYLGRAQEKPVPFEGRDDELKFLDEWLSRENERRYLLVAAPAGQGKSALLVRWTEQAQHKPAVAVIFVPISIRFQTNLPNVFLGLLSQELATVYGEEIPATGQSPASLQAFCYTCLRRTPRGGVQLLIVIDGLDEARDLELGPNLFPPLLPNGVKVVVSARFIYEYPDANAWLAKLGWDSQIAGQLALPPLPRTAVARILAKGGVDTTSSEVDQLYKLCDNGDPLLVRLYADEILSRGGRKLDWDSITPGLSGYLDQWFKDLRNQKGHGMVERTQAVLTVLACALAPLENQDLLELVPPNSGLDGIPYLKEALRDLDRVITGDGERYGVAFAHPRLRDHFNNQLSPLTRQRTESRFTEWGESVLRHLHQGTVQPEAVPRYLIGYYGAHLELAHAEPDRLQELICEPWLRAAEAADGSPDRFLRDVQRSWTASETQSDAGIGPQIRAALIFSSIASLSNAVDKAFIVSAVRAGFLSPSFGLVMARQKPAAEDRVFCLTELARNSNDARESILIEALSVIPKIRLGRNRAAALAKVADELPQDLLPRALALAFRIRGRHWRAPVLTRIAARMGNDGGEILTYALEAANTMESHYHHALALMDIAVLENDNRRRGDLLREALDIARDEPDNWRRALALAQLSGLLSDEWLSRAVWKQAVKSAKGRPLRRRRSLLHLLRLRAGTAGEQEQSANQVLTAAEKFTHARERGRLLHDFVEFGPAVLQRDTINRLVERACKGGAANDDIRRLIERWGELLDHAASERLFNVTQDRTVQSMLLPYLPPDLRVAETKNLNRSFSQIGDRDAQDLVLGRVVAKLTPGDRSRFHFNQTSQAAPTQEFPNKASYYPPALFDHWKGPFNSMPEIQPTADEAAEALKSFSSKPEKIARIVEAATRLASSDRQHLLERAIARARRISEPVGRALAMLALAKHAEGPLRLKAIGKAASAAEKVEDLILRARLLTAAVIYCPGEQPHNLLDRGIHSLLSLPNHWVPRVFKIKPGMRFGEEREPLGFDNDRNTIIHSLVTNIQPELARRGIGQLELAIHSIYNPYRRTYALISLASKMAEPQALLEQAADQASQLKDIYWRVHALYHVGLLAPSNLARESFQQAFDWAQNIQADSRSIPLIAIAKRLGPDTYEKLFRAIQASYFSADRSPGPEISAALARELPASLLSQFLDLIVDFGIELHAPHVLSNMADRWEEMCASEYCTQVSRLARLLRSVAGRERAYALQCLGALVPVIERNGGDTALADTAAAISDVCHWWP